MLLLFSISSVMTEMCCDGSAPCVLRLFIRPLSPLCACLWRDRCTLDVCAVSHFLEKGQEFSFTLP
ncbi:hypothetical protein M758_7G118500 [Ceratodon purpureus]|uniref:Secreted protein n=1 Tax=Ceratodon purpureus TaxID=3225 RepID=A0A8T0H8M0_CERPU|nr:hypothetical protein KC19_7G158400 [Ceratodon purpureus]KAG0611133.1 hypothetical protein M758_7G118500 [Ceratodon purpureus]